MPTTDDAVLHNAVEAQIDERWQAFLASFSDLDPATMNEPGVTGAWSLKQVIGHVAFWDEADAAASHRRAAGLPADGTDWATENDSHGPRIAAQSIDDVLADLYTSHAAIVAELRSLAPDDPRTPERAEAIRSATIEHYDEHAAEIRSWRDRTAR